MRVLLSALFFCVLFFLSISVFSQDCSNAKNKCKNPDKSFKVSAASRSIKMRRGKKSRIVLNAYGGKEYFFSTYSRPKVGHLQFRIINSVTNKVLYDNSAEGLVSEKIFKMEATQKLYIEILAPNWTSKNAYECAAFKIASRNIHRY